MSKKIYPCLWFNQNAHEAAKFYCSVFKDAKIIEENNFVSNWESQGQRFMCLNGGPEFKMNPSISFFTHFDSKEEIDEAWAKLSEGGMVMMPLDKYPWSERYGFVQDKYGACWQLYTGDFASVKQKFVPSFMFVGEQHGRAKEAIAHYTSIFPNSKVEGILEYEPGEDLAGTVKHAQFILDGYVFMAMDSGMNHHFQFNEGVSVSILCDDQAQVDHYWSRLTDGGQESQCGWLKDKFGVSWQVVSSMLVRLMNDPERFPRVVQAFMKMKKFDIAALENA